MDQITVVEQKLSDGSCVYDVELPDTPISIAAISKASAESIALAIKNGAVAEFEVTYTKR